MNNLYAITVSILSLLFLIKRGQYHLHMFQLNSYRYERYGRFVGTHLSKIFSPMKIIFGMFILVGSFSYSYLDLENLFVLVGIIILYLIHCYRLYFPKEKIKKPLVYTKRVQRIIGVEVILYVAIIGLVMIVDHKLFPFVLISLLAPSLMVLANIILTPMEKFLKFYYYNDAKKMLKEHSDLKVIGITGSYGKTSTKFILETILQQEFTTLVTPHSYNTTLGVVITVRKWLNKSHEVFITEMGAKQKGDVEEICQLVKPNIGMITAVGPQHLESFGSLSNIIDTKFEMALNVDKTGKCFVNGDNINILEGMKRYNHVNYMTYGNDESNKLIIEEVILSPSGSSFVVRQGTVKESYHTRLFGMHNILNIVGAIGVAKELGMEYKNISTGVKELKPVPHRLELKRQGGYYILDDAFNSNPTGAAYALEVLNSFKDSQKIIMTPGMIELGELDHELHVEFGKQIGKVCDHVVLIGKKKTASIVEGLESVNYNMEKVVVLNSVYEGFAYINQIVSKGDVILIENDLPDNFNE